MVETAANEPFLAYMRENVFNPLGMSHTMADWTDSLIAFRTRYYELDKGGRYQNAPAVDNSWKWAGGGFLSTSEDLVRFADAHSRPGFLTQESLDLLHTPLRLNSGQETDYGLGWTVRTDESGRRIVGHTGGSVGGSTVMILYPRERIAVALISNVSEMVGNRNGLAEALAAPFLDALDAGSR